MGRAARRKAQTREARRPRTVAVLNSDTGQIETFRVVISDQGVADWLRDRDHLKVQGYPDRPPDYDDRKQRFWRARPGEMPELSQQELSQMATRGRFICAWVTGLPELRVTFKLLAFERPDSTFVVKEHVIGPSDGRSVEHSYDSWLEVVVFVTAVKRQWLSMGCAEPTVLTSGEAEAALSAYRSPDGPA
jgi:hypothetical protein